MLYDNLYIFISPNVPSRTNLYKVLSSPVPHHNQATTTVAAEGEKKIEELAALLVYLRQLHHCHAELMLAWV